MSTEIRVRRGTRAALESLNPILRPGEEVLEVLAENPDGSLEYPRHPETGQALVLLKYGDGKTAWNDLEYASGPPGPSGGGAGGDIPDATTAVKGRVRFATDAEARDLENGLIALTPKNLAALRATESSPGLVKLAPAGDFSSPDLAATPAGVRAAIEAIDIPHASLTAPGVVKLAASTDATSADKAATPLNVQTALARASGGGLAEWDAGHDYLSGPRFVWGADDKLYQWLSASGPNTGAGPRDPATPPAVAVVPSPAPIAWNAAVLPSSIVWRGASVNGAGMALTIGGTQQAAYSTNGGQTWTAAALPSSGNWYRAALNEAGAAVAVIHANTPGGGTTAGAYSVNGGRTWAAMALPSVANWCGVSINDHNQAAAVSTLVSNKAAYSTDGGKTWSAATLPEETNWGFVSINNLGQAVAAAQNTATAAWSADGGRTWTKAALPEAANWFGIALNGQGQAVTTTLGGGLAAYSTDGGRTWAAAALPASAAWYGVAINEHGAAVTVAQNSASAAYSADGGRTWTALTLPSSADWRNPDITASGRVVVTGASSTKALYADWPMLWVAAWSPHWAAYDAARPGENVATAGRAAPRDCLPYDGGLYARAEYPALWEFVETFCAPVADAQWTAVKYSIGDGAATFRIPKTAQTDPVITNYLKAR